MSREKVYFKAAEFRCKCCKTGSVSESLRERLEAARIIAGVPFVITSGFRCAKAQQRLIAEGKSQETSSHPKGLAVDIAISSSERRWIILEAILKAGLRRIGISPAFIHVDIDVDKPQNVIWMYET